MRQGSQLHFTEADRKKIKALADIGVSKPAIALRFNVSGTTIRNMLRKGANGKG